jgi:hypothetical protein
MGIREFFMLLCIILHYQSIQMDTELKKNFNRINEKLAALLTGKEQQQKITLVKMGVVRALTGLDKEGMRRARENNFLTQHRTPTGIWYELETIHPIILKGDGIIEKIKLGSTRVVPLHSRKSAG